MRVARVVLVFSALPFAGIGLAFLVAPSAMGAFVGLTLDGAVADNDLRAVYGGLQLGIALFLAWCAAAPERLRAGVAAQLCTFGGLAFGRVVSWGVAGSPGELGIALHGAELFGVAAGIVAWRALPPPTRD